MASSSTSPPEVLLPVMFVPFDAIIHWDNSLNERVGELLSLQHDLRSKASGLSPDERQKIRRELGRYLKNTEVIVTAMQFKMKNTDPENTQILQKRLNYARARVSWAHRLFGRDATFSQSEQPEKRPKQPKVEDRSRWDRASLVQQRPVASGPHELPSSPQSLFNSDMDDDDLFS